MNNYAEQIKDLIKKWNEYIKTLTPEEQTKEFNKIIELISELEEPIDGTVH